MSLSRRLFTLMLLVLLGFSLGIFFIQVNNTRDALAERQRVELSNLAQSLSLALVPHVELGDAASAEALIRATVDGGHVRDARLESVAIATPIASPFLDDDPAVASSAPELRSPGGTFAL